MGQIKRSFISLIATFVLATMAFAGNVNTEATCVKATISCQENVVLASAEEVKKKKKKKKKKGKKSGGKKKGGWWKSKGKIKNN